MPFLRMPATLRSYTLGQSEISLQGETVGQMMDDLVAQFPALRTHLYNGEGGLRPFVNLFIGEQNIKDLQGLETALKADDRVLLLPSIAGG